MTTRQSHLMNPAVLVFNFPHLFPPLSRSKPIEFNSCSPSNLFQKSLSFLLVLLYFLYFVQQKQLLYFLPYTLSPSLYPTLPSSVPPSIQGFSLSCFLLQYLPLDSTPLPTPFLIIPSVSFYSTNLQTPTRRLLQYLASDSDSDFLLS